MLGSFSCILFLTKCHPRAKKFHGRIVKPGGTEESRLAKEFQTEIWFAQSGPGRSNWNLGPNKHRSLCVEIARLSGVDDFEKCAGHALRALCVTHCIGAGLSAADVAAKVRHAAINSSKSHAQECNERKANRMACVNPSKQLTKKSSVKRPSPPPQDETEEATVDVAKRRKVTKTQLMLEENRQRFHDLIGDSPIGKALSKVAALPVIDNEAKENESPSAELKALQQRNEILRLKAENARLEQEIANAAVIEAPPRPHRHSFPSTHHCGPELSRHENFGYRHSHPPTSRCRSRSPSPRHDRRSGRYPEDHGCHYESDCSGHYDCQDCHHGRH